MASALVGHQMLVLKVKASMPLLWASWILEPDLHSNFSEDATILYAHAQHENKWTVDQITPRRRFERRREVSALLRSSDLSYFVSDFLFLIVFLFEWRWSHEGDGVGVVEDGYSGVEACVTPMRTKIIIWVTRTQNILGEKWRRNLVSVAVLRSLEHLGCGGLIHNVNVWAKFVGRNPGDQCRLNHGQ